MKTRMQIHNPDTVELELSITMTVGQWKKFREQITASDLATSYPLRQIRENILEAVSRMAAHVEQESEMD